MHVNRIRILNIKLIACFIHIFWSLLYNVLRLKAKGKQKIHNFEMNDKKNCWECLTSNNLTYSIANRHCFTLPTTNNAYIRQKKKKILLENSEKRIFLPQINPFFVYIYFEVKIKWATQCVYFFGCEWRVKFRIFIFSFCIFLSNHKINDKTRNRQPSSVFLVYFSLCWWYFLRLTS